MVTDAANNDEIDTNIDDYNCGDNGDDNDDEYGGDTDDDYIDEDDEHDEGDDGDADHTTTILIFFNAKTRKRVVGAPTSHCAAAGGGVGLYRLYSCEGRVETITSGPEAARRQ